MGNYKTFGNQDNKIGGLFAEIDEEVTIENIYNQISNGKIDIVIGTHALLNDNLTFQNLGLVITDEQHRFGVMQRTLADSPNQQLTSFMKRVR